MADTSQRRRPSRAVISKTKKIMAIAIGTLIFRFMPAYRNRLLSKWPGKGLLTGFRYLMFRVVGARVISEYYRPATSTSRREELKSLCMGGDGGLAWVQHYAARGFDRQEAETIPMFRVLERILARGETKLVHQVACGSGRKVAYLARRHPEIEFIGSDLDSVASSCRERWKELPNLTISAVHLDRLNPEERTYLQADLVYASGSLQYLDEASLRRFLRIVRKSTNMFLMVEPLAREFLLKKIPIPRDGVISPGITHTLTICSKPDGLTWNTSLLKPQPTPLQQA